MHAWLDHRLAEALGLEPAFNGRQDLVVAERQGRDIGSVQICEMNRLHAVCLLRWFLTDSPYNRRRDDVPQGLLSSLSSLMIGLL